MKKTIALDLGKVAIAYDFEQWILGLAEFFAVHADEIRALWQSDSEQPHSFHARADRGLSSREIYEGFARCFNRAPSFEEFKKVFNESAAISVIDGFIEFRDELASSGADLIVISNMTVLHRDYIVMNMPHIFDPYIPPECRFFSCDLGVSKSDNPEHFREIARKINRAVESILLIDDRRENIDGIIAAGGDGILHSGDFLQTKNELKKRGIL